MLMGMLNEHLEEVGNDDKEEEELRQRWTLPAASNCCTRDETQLFRLKFNLGSLNVGKCLLLDT